MSKNYFLAILYVAFFMFAGIKVYAEDDTVLMGCLVRPNKNEISECLRKEFSNSNFFFADKSLICQSNNLSQEIRINCDKEKVRWFDQLLENWQVIYSQCSSGMTVTRCISQIKFTSCERVGQREDDIGGFGKGTCYALAAFVKRDSSICENQFYESTKMNCNAWLEALCSGNAHCKERSFIKNEGKYFNWIYEDGTVGMEDVGFCMAMDDPDNKNKCFLSAGNCEEISDVQKRNICHLILQNRKSHSTKVFK